MTPRPTPLSDLITRCAVEGTRESRERFLDAFLKSTLGIIASGADLPPAGSGHRVTATDQIRCGMLATPDGTPMLAACADRGVFVQRFHQRFNAEVDAPALLRIALANPPCAGIIINSAASEHSMVIIRAELTPLLERVLAGPSSPKPWWKLW